MKSPTWRACFSICLSHVESVFLCTLRSGPRAFLAAASALVTFRAHLGLNIALPPIYGKFMDFNRGNEWNWWTSGWMGHPLFGSMRDILESSGIRLLNFLSAFVRWGQTSPRYHRSCFKLVLDIKPTHTTHTSDPAVASAFSLVPAAARCTHLRSRSRRSLDRGKEQMRASSDLDFTRGVKRTHNCTGSPNQIKNWLRNR